MPNLVKNPFATNALGAPAALDDYCRFRIISKKQFAP